MMISKDKVRLSVVTILGVATLAGAPVYAQHGANESGDTASSGNTSTTATDTSTGTSGSGSTTTTSGSKHHGAESTELSTESNTEETANSDTSGSDSIHDRAEKLLAAKREGHQEKSLAVRQKVCDNHKTEIDGKLTNLGTRAQKHLDTFNDIFTKVQAFQTSKQLAAANYDSLVATATAKQASATAAVVALKALSGTTIDCTSSDPASSLAAVKAAADDAKSTLQAYRSSVKDVIKALQSAKSATNTEGSN